MLELLFSPFYKILDFLSAWIKTAASIEYRLPTIITFVVMLLKFFVNRSVCALDAKKGFIELPCEIVTLSLGFVIIKINNTHETIFRVFVLIFLLILNAALVNYLQRDEILSELKFFNFKFWLCVLCYILAVFSFYFSMQVAIV